METAYLDSPLDFEDAAYPCKGCGEILEEGKAYELANHRWHIDCFRCNTCHTLLNSDANLLLLGDGSLICNNCTYNCSSCGNKIEDLAILTGDQAFCATCFKCRNCKRKIENLRYARTSQGIFCMDCHEALMARRRKKSARNAAGAKKNSNSSHLDKSLPSLPSKDAYKESFDSGAETLWIDPQAADPSMEAPSVTRTLNELRTEVELEASTPNLSVQAPSQSEPPARDTPSLRDSDPASGASLTLPSTTYRAKRHSYQPPATDAMSDGQEGYLIPLAFDPTPVKETPASLHGTPQTQEERMQDYFPRSSTQSKVSSNGRSSTPQATSPHIAFQEKARQPSIEHAEHNREASHSDSQNRPPFLPERNRQRSTESPPVTQVARTESPRREPFKLQEAPKSRTEAKSGANTPRTDSGDHSKSPYLQERLNTDPGRLTPRVSEDANPPANGSSDASRPAHGSMSGVIHNIPKRGDSLESANAANKRVIPRKEVKPTTAGPSAAVDKKRQSLTSPLIAELPGDYGLPVNTKIISAPIAPAESRSTVDTPNASLQRSGAENGVGSFVEPRSAPQPPADTRPRTDSLSNLPSEAVKNGDQHKSPKLPRWSAGGDFTLDEDMARILGGDEALTQESFLRRVSNSVRHGRSHSDKSGRISRDRWPPRSPVVTSTPGQDIGSPNNVSPENREELSWYKTELRREKEKALEREKKIAALEAQLDSSANIKQANSELREKRSTMVVLDTQREMAVRELETLSEHIAKAKTSQEPFDFVKLSSAVLRDFAASLERLKNGLAPQIEELVQKRNDMLAAIAHLNSMKDKSFQEFEQLSSKNAQLAELNNQLVHQIQGIYKANTSLTSEAGRSPAPNGLGIYAHHKDKSSISIDTRDLKAVHTEPSIAESGTTLQGDAEQIQVIGGPNVVSIKKIQPKKFDWRRGQKVAKGMAKGVKGAFSSTQQSYNRDLQFAETGAYGQMPTGQEHNQAPKPTGDQQKQGFGFFNQKGQVKGNGLYAGPQANTSTPSLTLDPATHLFGSDLEQRADYEKTTIPAIVKRCVEEVESRGMDQEGIYRKSGGNSQVQQVKDSFENPGSDFNISDPDLDIHSITSCLKQFFRKLPTPLITYEVYDRLLECTNIPEGPSQKSQRIEAIADALHDLPKTHYQTLEYLMQHLAKVVVREKENLMTPLNIAVVFAPTIMRPESVSRELTDTKAKNEVVMWMVESSEKLFGN